MIYLRFYIGFIVKNSSKTSTRWHHSSIVIFWISPAVFHIKEGKLRFIYVRLFSSMSRDITLKTSG